MTRSPFRWLLFAGPFLAGVSLFAGAQNAPRADSDYRTVANAITTRPTTDAPGGAGQTGYLGVSVMRDAQGQLVVEDVSTDSPGAKAGLKTGDRITRIGDRAVTSPQAFREWLQTYSPGTTVKLNVLRANQPVELTAKLTATSRPMTLAKGGKGGKGKGGKGGFKGGMTLPLWTKPVLRLAVVCIEFSDVKANAKVMGKDWQEAFFSKGTYANKKSATDQTVHGSLNDYFLEQSAGAFHLEGQVFDWVDVGKKRGEYIQGTGTSNKNVVLTDALAKLAARDGKDALKDFDALLFLYAGERYQTNPGAVYFPHVGTVFEGEKRWPYLLTAAGASRMTAVNGFTKLVGQVMGLPDQAARREDAGSLGLGVWCALSNPITDGRPQHFSAWAKEKLGWIQPAILDPTVKQKLILAPIEDSPKECYKILVRPNGSEYYLLENRRKKGFDADLPAEGLLIWRVVDGRPVLCPSHGVEGPRGPLEFLSAVPYPSEANNAFTPDTTPSSRSPLGGGLPVHLTDIRRLPDGRITFSIGYEYR